MTKWKCKIKKVPNKNITNIDSSNVGPSQHMGIGAPDSPLFPLTPKHWILEDFYLFPFSLKASLVHDRSSWKLLRFVLWLLKPPYPQVSNWTRKRRVPVTSKSFMIVCSGFCYCCCFLSVCFCVSLCCVFVFPFCVLGISGSLFSTLILSLSGLVSLDDKIKVEKCSPQESQAQNKKTQTHTETPKHTDTKQQPQENQQHTII